MLYTVLELADGGDLFDFVASAGRFDERYARNYCLQLFEGLDYCH